MSACAYWEAISFVPAVLRDIEAAAASTPMSGPTGIPLVVPEKPSLAVLPFASMSSDPDDAFFAQGIAADLTTLFSRTRQRNPA
jgi:adenylate cyclase